MCGLAGFVRPPNAPDLEKAQAVAFSLTKAAEKRGKHATGFAVLGASKSFIAKWPLSMTKIVENGLYQRKVQDSTPEDVRFFLGHTRHATLDNKHDRDSAHPFQFENGTVGCHNGMIYNWQEVMRDNKQEGWTVDSQAALWAIDSRDDIAEALKMLDGWWALSWVKDGKLHLTRTDDRPLTVAFVPKLQTLFWGSLREDVTAAMKSHGLAANIWELTNDTVYIFDPAAFKGNATNAEKIKVKLDRPSAKLAKKKDVNVKHLGGRGRTVSEAGYKSFTKKKWSGGLGRTRDWNSGPTLSGLEARIKGMEERMEEQDGIIESQRAELDYMFELLAESGIMDGPSCEECGEMGGDLLEMGEGRMIHSECVLK